MNSINDINYGLVQIDELVEDREKRVEYLKGEIVSIINDVQNEFGKSKEGQDIVKLLFEAINALSKVDGQSSMMRSNIKKCQGKVLH